MLIMEAGKSDPIWLKKKKKSVKKKKERKETVLFSFSEFKNGPLFFIKLSFGESFTQYIF